LAKHVAVLGVIATLLVNWLSDETKAWIPWCARKFFDLSVRLLPPAERERYSEEWRGHIQSFPGTGFASAQFFLAALQIRGVVMKGVVVERWVHYRARAVWIGFLVFCWLNVRWNRIFGSQKPSTHELTAENSNLIVAVLVILIAFVWMEQSKKQSTAMA